MGAIAFAGNAIAPMGRSYGNHRMQDRRGGSPNRRFAHPAGEAPFLQPQESRKASRLKPLPRRSGASALRALFQPLQIAAHRGGRGLQAFAESLQGCKTLLREQVQNQLVTFGGMHECDLKSRVLGWRFGNAGAVYTNSG